MKILNLLAGFVLFLASSVSFATGGGFEKLKGTWVGGGEVRGVVSEQRMTWSQSLGGAFIKLEFDNRMKHSSGSEFHFQATAYYQMMPGGGVSGTWFDSRGVSFPVKGTMEGSRFFVEWGTVDSEFGRTEYRILDGRLEVTDEVLSEGGEWRVFGRSTLERSGKITDQ
jgi:hypothetical protein